MLVNLLDLGWEDREESIELVNQFFRKVNSLNLDGLYAIKPRAATKFVDLYLKLSRTDKVYFRGIRVQQDESSRAELVSLLIARIEEKPFLKEERTLYVDIAVTKGGKKKKGYMGILLADLEKWAKEHSIPSIELIAICENTEAVQFWKNKGFHEFYIRYRKPLIFQDR